MPRGASPAFHRQVLFRIGPDDSPLLEAATREHGTQQAAIIAGLRALAARRLSGGSMAEAPAAAPPSSAEVVAPAKTDDPDWWAPVDDAARIFDLSVPALRRLARRSGAPLRTQDGVSEVRLDLLEVDTAYVAAHAGVSVDTARSWGKARRMGAVEHGGRYFFPLGRVELGIPAAANHFDETASETEKRIDRGELPELRDQRGHRTVNLLDVIDQLGR